MIDEIVPVELKEEHPLRDKLLPILLAVVVFALDQITKLLVVLNISPYTIGVSFFGDFLLFAGYCAIILAILRQGRFWRV